MLKFVKKKHHYLKKIIYFIFHEFECKNKTKNIVFFYYIKHVELILSNGMFINILCFFYLYNFDLLME